MLNAQQQPFWTPLTMAEEGQPTSFLKVVRCDDKDGSVRREGGSWKMLEV